MVRAHHSSMRPDHPVLNVAHSVVPCLPVLPGLFARKIVTEIGVQKPCGHRTTSVRSEWACKNLRPINVDEPRHEHGGGNDEEAFHGRIPPFAHGMARRSMMMCLLRLIRLLCPAQAHYFRMHYGPSSSSGCRARLGAATARLRL